MSLSFDWEIRLFVRLHRRMINTKTDSDKKTIWKGYNYKQMCCLSYFHYSTAKIYEYYLVHSSLGSLSKKYSTSLARKIKYLPWLVMMSLSFGDTWYWLYILISSKKSNRFDSSPGARVKMCLLDAPECVIKTRLRVVGNDDNSHFLQR